MKFLELTIEMQVLAYKRAKEWFKQDGIYDKDVIMEYLNDKNDFKIVDCSPIEDGSEFTVEF